MIQNKEKIKDYLISLIIILMVYLGMKYLVPLFIPFLLAGFIVLIIDPVIVWIHRKTHISKGITAFFILMFFLFLIVLFMWFLSSSKYFSISQLMRISGEWYDKCCEGLGDVCGLLEKSCGVDAVELEVIFRKTTNDIAEYVKIELTPSLLNHSFSYMKAIVIGIADLIVMFISVILIEKDISGMREKGRNNKLLIKGKEIVDDCIKMIRVFLKAQITIMGCVAALCILFLFLIGYSKPVSVGLLIAFLDVLPFIGTSIVLIPWIIVSILSENYYCAFMLLLLWIAASSVRELLEPRLIGKKMGVFPIIIMISIYVGIKLFGFMGIIYGPLSLILIDRLIRSVVVDK